MLRRKRKTKNEIADFFFLKARKPAKSKRLASQNRLTIKELCGF
jgi:hypothetical protein